MPQLPFRTGSLVNPSTSGVFDTWAFRGRGVQEAPLQAGALPGVTDAQRAAMFSKDRVYLTSVDGVFGAGGNLKVSFSDDNSSYTDYLATVTAAVTTPVQLGNVPHRYWRAQVTAGDGTTALFVSLLAVMQD